MKRLPREYPTVNGFPVHPLELDLPAPRFNEGRQIDFNNHHLAFTARRMGQLVLTQTMRDLDEFQLVMPKETHAILHDRYEPPRHIPTLYDLMNHIDDAFEAGKLLRYGSAHNPMYKTITPALLRACKDEYDRLTVGEKDSIIA